MGIEPVVQTDPNDAGYSLFEMVVVVALVGILSFGVVLNTGLGPGRSTATTTDAERFAQITRDLSERAINSAQPFVLELTSTGYTISLLNASITPRLVPWRCPVTLNTENSSILLWTSGQVTPAVVSFCDTDQQISCRLDSVGKTSCATQ